MSEDKNVTTLHFDNGTITETNEGNGWVRIQGNFTFDTETIDKLLTRKGNDGTAKC